MAEGLLLLVMAWQRCCRFDGAVRVTNEAGQRRRPWGRAREPAACRAEPWGLLKVVVGDVPWRRRVFEEEGEKGGREAPVHGARWLEMLQVGRGRGRATESGAS